MLGNQIFFSEMSLFQWGGEGGKISKNFPNWNVPFYGRGEGLIEIGTKSLSLLFFFEGFPKWAKFNGKCTGPSWVLPCWRNGRSGVTGVLLHMLTGLLLSTGWTRFVRQANKKLVKRVIKQTNDLELWTNCFNSGSLVSRSMVNVYVKDRQLFSWTKTKARALLQSPYWLLSSILLVLVLLVVNIISAFQT